MYPVLKPDEKQTSRNAFVVTKDGLKKSILVETPGGSFSTIMELNDVEKEYLKSLPSGAPSLELNLRKIPFSDTDGGFLQAWTYFRAVWDKQKSEAFVWWHFDADLNKYLMVVPPFYSASAAHLNYPDVNRFCGTCRVGLFDGLMACHHCGDAGVVKRLQVYGTSHSHGALSAFHSTTDHANEMNQTGFHITFGEIDKGPFLAPSFVVKDSNTRFNTDWRHHFDYEPEVQEFGEKYLGLWLTLITNHTNTGQYRVIVGDNIVFENQSRTVCEAYVRARGEGVIDLKPVVVSVMTSEYKPPVIVDHKPKTLVDIKIRVSDSSIVDDIEDHLMELEEPQLVFGVFYVLNEIDPEIVEAYEYSDQVGIGRALFRAIERLTLKTGTTTYNWSEAVKRTLAKADDADKIGIIRLCEEQLQQTQLFDNIEEIEDEDLWNTTEGGRGWQLP